MDELQSALQATNTAVFPFLQHINSLLYNAVLTCRATVQTTSQAIAFKTQSEPIAPGKKAEHQWRYRATTKVAGRKRKGIILKHASPAKRDALITRLKVKY